MIHWGTLNVTYMCHKQKIRVVKNQSRSKKILSLMTQEEVLKKYKTAQHHHQKVRLINKLRRNKLN